MGKYLQLVLIAGIGLIYDNAHGQCSGAVTMGPSPICPGTQANYWVVGASNCNIVFVAGTENSFNGSTVSWGNIAGTYQITFQCDCGTTYKNITVKSSAVVGGFINDVTICSGESTTLEVEGFYNQVLKWQEKISGSWVNIPNSASSTITVSPSSTRDYRARIRNSCSGVRTWSGRGTVFITQLTGYVLSGGGDFCGGTTTELTLIGSEPYVNYQMKKDGVNYEGIRSTMDGSPIDWFTIDESGYYTVVATKNGCSANMTSGATVNFIALPAKYNVSGGGTYCEGQSGPSITLSDSETGVTYSLKQGSTSYYSTQNGTGGALTWTGITIAGTYIIVGNRSGCTRTMNSSATVSISPKPNLSNLPATKNIQCGNSVNFTIASDLGGTFQWTNSSSAGVTVNQNSSGSTINDVITLDGVSFGSVTYTITPTGPSPYFCDGTTKILTVNVTGPETGYYFTAPSTTICPDESIILSLNNSQTTYSYVLQRQGGGYSSTIPGTGGLITWVNINQAGVYEAFAVNGSCSSRMSSSITISEIILNDYFLTSDKDAYCENSNGVSLTLNDSDPGVIYTLKRNSITYSNPQSGSGNPVYWNVTDPGQFRVLAQRDGCTEKAMSGIVNLTETLAPVIQNFPTGTQNIDCGDIFFFQPNLNISNSIIEWSGTASAGVSGHSSGSGLEINDQLNLTDVASGTVTYTIKAVGPGPDYCKGLDQIITVDISAAYAIMNFPSGPLTKKCGDSFQLNPMFNTTGSTYSYTVLVSNVLIDSSGTTFEIDHAFILDNVSSGTVIYNFTPIGPGACPGLGQELTINVTGPQTGLFLYANNEANICPGEPVAISINGIETEYDYILMFEDSDLVNNPTDITNGTKTWHDIDVVGEYVAYAVNGSCQQRLTSSITITETIIDEYTLTGGGNYCANEDGVNLYFSGTQVGIIYELIYSQQSLPYSTRTGDGDTLMWINVKTQGNYHVIASDIAGNCTEVAMPGTLTVTELSIPTVPVIGNLNEICNVTVVYKSVFDPTWYWQSDPYAPVVSPGDNDRDSIIVSTNKWIYLMAFDGQCWSEPDSIYIEINGDLFDFNGRTTIFQGEITRLNVTGPDITSVTWYNQGVVVGNGYNYITPVLYSDETYFVEVVNEAGCQRVDSVIVNVISPDNLTPDDVNHIFTFKYQVPNATGDPATLDPYVVQTFSQVIDGLGRVVQTIQKEFSPGFKDLQNFNTYDGSGRVNESFLPFENGTNGLFKTDPVSTQTIFYDNLKGDGNGSNAFAKTVYESSSLNRVLELGAPGSDWQPVEGNPGAGNTVLYSYESNTTDDAVTQWYLVDDLPTYSISYSDNELNMKEIRDEEGHIVQEFTNKLGQTLLKKVQVDELATTWANTYYIYGIYGNLRFVLPPEASARYDAEYATDPQAFLAKWAFQYQYDVRNRMISKQVPGADPVFLVYDGRNRLVLAQDGNQRDASVTSGKDWSFTKYDAFDRPVLTGVYEHDQIVDQVTMQSLVDTHYDGAPEKNWYEEYGITEPIFGYTNRSFPSVSDKSNYLTVIYYDHYTFMDYLLEFTNGYEYSQPTGICINKNDVDYCFATQESSRIRGQISGTKIRSLNDPQSWFNSVMYYDQKYRLIQTISNNQRGGLDTYSNLYDFVGNILVGYVAHTTDNGNDLAIKTRFEYDHVNRLVRGYHELFDQGTSQGEVLLAENLYNEIGELVEKNLHMENNVPLQSIDYRYNIRGWLQSINNSTLTIDVVKNDDIPDHLKDMFGMELIYNTPINGIPNN